MSIYGGFVVRVIEIGRRKGAKESQTRGLGL